LVLIFRFFPREFSFIALFKEQVTHSVAASALLKELALKGVVDHYNLERIHHIEHEGDDVAHKIIDQLNKSFITPFDREDILSLAKKIDDIVDTLDAIISRLNIYKINRIDNNLVQFSMVIDESVKAIAIAVSGLNNTKNSKAIKEACIEVNRLENVGDAMRDTFLGNLFETENNPIELIKWKEIYQDAETVLDICEDVANIVESIMVKHS